MYDHKKIEQEIRAFWEKEKIYEKLKQKNAGSPPFYFCDGPPYATGQIHPGTGWNKIIKDTICRYKRMCGYNVRSQAGYDTHGLPIEVKVEQELGIKNKNEIEKKGIDKFVEKCKYFATKHIDIMGEQFKQLGVWMDFDKPYITYKDSYINSSWKTLKLAYEKGLMYEGVYVLPYCFRCETTMANYELEYGEEKDPSIYVKFKSKNANDENEYLIIWTTTPWTLVANMAVMVHPTLAYVKVKVDDEVWIIAKARMDAVLSIVGKSGVVLEEISGKKLEGKQYFHPFQQHIKKEYDRRILLSDDFVTVEEGTGLVHSAPGHGPEDFIVGKRFGIEPFSPVDEHGNFTEEAGDLFVGKNVRETNSQIIELLNNLGVLLHKERIQHRYPHCWRCKTPLIFLTTKQWFITVSKMKEKMLEEIEKTDWHPDFAKMRFKEFVNVAPDWCISRQRYWGIPLPIWKCKKEGCGKIRVIGSKNELSHKQSLPELHRPFIDNVELQCECGSKMHRIADVLDVWFDSGNSVWASLDDEDVKTYSERADLIIEGQDQIRGWFYSLLGSGIIRYNEVPYKRVLMHGFFVDEKGEKMSKSLGNFIPLEEILSRYGADSFRLWSLSNPIWEELRFNWNEMKEASADLLILFNLVTFLEQSYPHKKLEKPELGPDDCWLISRLHSTLKEFRTSFENYELHKAVKAVRGFLVNDISRFYMKIAKERIKSNKNKDGVLFSLYTTLLFALKMLGPIAPFLSEYLYRKFFKRYEKEESLSLLQMPEEDANAIDLALEKRIEIVKEIFSAALTSRQEAEKGLRWPLKRLYIETQSHEVAEALEVFKPMLSVLLNIKEITTCDKKPDVKGLHEQSFSNGKTYLDALIDEALYEEGITNEIKRRIQALRKKESLVPEDRIIIHACGEKEIEKVLEKHKKKLLEDVGATELIFQLDKKAEEYNIDGRLVKIAIKKK